MVVPYSQYLYLVSCGNHGEEHTPVLSLGRIDLTKSQVINIWHCQQDFSACEYFNCLKEELSGCPLSFNSAFIYRAPNHNLLWCKVPNQMPNSPCVNQIKGSKSWLDLLGWKFPHLGWCGHNWHRHCYEGWPLSVFLSCISFTQK